MRKARFQPAAFPVLPVIVSLGLLLAGCASLDVGGQVAAARSTRAALRAELLRTDRITTILVGTGGPMVSGRAQAATAVFVGGQFLLFDAGDGSARKLEALDLPVAELSAVFLTHFHSDHVADLGEAVDRSWVNGRRSPLAVYGPPGTSDIVAGFLAAYRAETGLRTAHHGESLMPPGFAGASAAEFAPPTDLDAVLVYERDGVVVKAFRAEHPPVEPSVGYRVEYKGGSVVLSGDTIPTEALRLQCEGADLLVADAMAKDLVARIERANREVGNDFNAEILLDIRDYHMDVAEVAKLAAEARVTRLALTHLAPPLEAPAQVDAVFRRPVEKIYEGELFVGPDGTTIVVPLE